DYIKLTDEGRFEATHPENSLLSAAPPVSFGFLGPSPRGITLRSDGGTPAELSVQSGQSLSLIGGDITIEHATARAPDGRVNLTSVGGPAEVSESPDLSALPQGGTVHLMGLGRIDVSGAGGGQVVIRAGQLCLENSATIHSYS